MTIENFLELAKQIQMENGLDEETASHYAALVGDTPVLDEDGLVFVYEGEKEIARIKLSDG